VVDYYSHVAMLEPVDCTLSMVIRNRRKEELMWSFGEFCRLFADLVEGLSVMHGSGLTHNDIRPSNIYYSKQKECFLLGSFSNVMRRTVDKESKNVK
jgi:serine/threonine protein kinase